MQASALYYHAGDAAAMLRPLPNLRRRQRCATDGCFASKACGHTCRQCPYPVSCRNRTLGEIKLDQARIREQLDQRLWKAGTRTCAVVGSSASLLSREFGAEIDSADVVVRINTAPTRGFERHVGRRTSVRIWGAIAPPRELRRIGSKLRPLNKDGTRPVNGFKQFIDLIGNETVVRYCGPNPWFSYCWKNISGSEHSDPRFHPSAWRAASSVVYRDRQRCERLRCVPSSGVMAVLMALERCNLTRVYGFGVDGEGGVAAAGAAAGVCRASSAGGSVAPRCWKAQQCEKYYSCFGQGLLRGPDAMPKREEAPIQSWMNRSYAYFADSIRYHDIKQEWSWIGRLHGARRLRWLGAPDRRAFDADPCARKRAGCWNRVGRA